MKWGKIATLRVVPILHPAGFNGVTKLVFLVILG
jgi:hypothetical protein